MAPLSWQSVPPQLYNIVTGFFPETAPKETWETDPRPLLVCGVAKDPDNGMHFLRVAYGTTKRLDLARANDLVIGNMSMLNQLCLKNPTRFVIYTGQQMVILPWTDEFFKPWTQFRTPILSRLPQDMSRFVAGTLGTLSDLPQF
jgi:hypothetical protein